MVTFVKCHFIDSLYIASVSYSLFEPRTSNTTDFYFFFLKDFNKRFKRKTIDSNAILINEHVKIGQVSVTNIFDSSIITTMSFYVKKTTNFKLSLKYRTSHITNKIFLLRINFYVLFIDSYEIISSRFLSILVASR